MRHLLLLAVCLAVAGSARAQSDDADGALDSDSLGFADDFAGLEALLDMQVSTASKHKQSAREAPASVSVITADDIQAHGFRSLGEALETVRGLYVSYDRNYIYVGVRGVSRPTDFNNRILILIDGHSTNETVTGASNAGTALPVAMEMIERIEVVRGPGSSLYGTAAMFAVVNVVTKTIQERDGILASGVAGSQGRSEGFVGWNGRPSRRVAVSATARIGRTEGADLYFPEYDAGGANGGMARGLDWDQFASAAVRVESGPVQLTVRGGQRDKSIPTGAYETLFGVEGNETTDRTFLASALVTQPLSEALALTARAAYDHYYYGGRFLYEGDAPGDVLTNYDQYIDHRVTAESQLQWDLSARHRLVSGAALVYGLEQSYRNWDDTQDYSRFNLPQTTASVYAQHEAQLASGVTATVGGRFDHTTSFGAAFSPRAALLLSPIETGVLKLLYGEAFRAPTVYERRFSDPLSGVVSSPDLGPERIRTLEAVWEHQVSPVLYTSLGVYRNRIRGLIDTVELPDSTISFRNVGRANAQGVEAEVGFRRWGLATASAALQSATDGATGDVLSNSPRYLARASLATPYVLGVAFTGLLLAESGRQTVWGTETDGHVVLNVGARSVPIWDSVALGVSVRNVFNASYALPGGYEHVMPSILQDGRSVRLTLTYTP